MKFIYLLQKVAKGGDSGWWGVGGGAGDGDVATVVKRVRVGGRWWPVGETQHLEGPEGVNGHERTPRALLKSRGGGVNGMCSREGTPRALSCGW
jgi:hypothetical protein